MAEHHMETLGDVGIVASLFQACMDAIKIIIAQGVDDESFKTHIPKLKYIYHSLVLWNIDHSAEDGNLDRILQTAQGLQKATLIPLRSIIHILAFDLLRYAPMRAREEIREQHYTYQSLLDQSKFSLSQDDDELEKEVHESDSDEDTAETTDSEDYGVDASLQRLSFLVQCLFDLGDALDTPAQDPDYLNEPRTGSTSIRLAPYQAYVQKIRDRFPLAPMAVVENLGQANFRRHQQIIKRIEEEEEKEEEEAAQARAPTTQEATIDMSIRSATDFKDSGLGSSIPQALETSKLDYSEVSSVMSIMAEEAWKAFPQLTQDAKHGEPFHCVACGRMMIITKTGLWKKHLISDLLPYSCIAPGCEFNNHSFLDRTSWTQHMLLDHGTFELFTGKRCLLCNAAVLGGIEPLLRHISRHLEEISAAALPRSATSNTGNDTESDSSESISSLQFKLGGDSDKRDNKFTSQSLEGTGIDSNPERSMQQDSSGYTATEEPTARDYIRKALKEANNSKPPITDLSAFIELVRESYLPPSAYKKYMSIVVEEWNENRNVSPPSPSDRAIRSSLGSEASDVSRDSPYDLPVLDQEATPDTLFLMVQTDKPTFYYASYKQCNTPGSYIRAVTVRDKNLKAREGGLIEVQWKMVGNREIDDDHRIPHTACHVVNEEEAKSMNMDVDLVLGTDCRKEWRLQSLVAGVHRPSERPAGVMEGEGTRP